MLVTPCIFLMVVCTQVTTQPTTRPAATRPAASRPSVDERRAALALRREIVQAISEQRVIKGMSLVDARKAMAGWKEESDRRGTSGSYRWELWRHKPTPEVSYSRVGPPRLVPMEAGQRTRFGTDRSHDGPLVLSRVVIATVERGRVTDVVDTPAKKQ